MSVLPQVECTSAQMICVRKSSAEMEKTAAGIRENAKTVSPPFSAEKSLKHDQMTDKHFGILIGSSLWLPVVVVEGSYRPQW